MDVLLWRRVEVTLLHIRSQARVGAVLRINIGQLLNIWSPEALLGMNRSQGFKYLNDVIGPGRHMPHAT